MKINLSAILIIAIEILCVFALPLYWGEDVDARAAFLFGQLVTMVDMLLVLILDIYMNK
jgi:hypothetical protein